MSYRWVYLLALLAVLPAAASEVYKTTDDEGRTVYTDQPPGDRKHEKVELEPINTQPPVQPRQTQEREAPPQQAAPDYRVALTSPQNEATIPTGQYEVPLTARVAPELSDDHAFLYFLDGAAYGEPTRSPEQVIEIVARGEHQVAVAVVNRDGDVVARSQPVTIYVFRPTIYSPARN